MVDHRPADATTSGRLDRVHGLHLSMVIVELLQRRDAQHLALQPEAEEGHAWVEEGVDVEGVDVLGWGMQVGVGKMALQNRAHILFTRVVDRDHASGR